MEIKKEEESVQQTLAYSHQNSFASKTFFLCSHDNIMRIIPVVDNVFKVNTSVLLEVFEELLVEYEGHSTDLAAGRFFPCAVISKVCSDCKSQLSSELPLFKSRE